MTSANAYPTVCPSVHSPRQARGGTLTERKSKTSLVKNNGVQQQIFKSPLLVFSVNSAAVRISGILVIATIHRRVHCRCPISAKPKRGNRARFRLCLFLSDGFVSIKKFSGFLYFNRLLEFKM